MSSWLSWVAGSGSKDTSGSANKAKNAIIELRQQLLMIDKQEEFLMKKIDDETNKARINATSNKRGP
jgi:charged multivesicular body protein 4A/B